MTKISLAVVLLLGALWLFGGLDWVSRWVAGAQQTAQEQLAAAIRALRGGEPGALMAFWGLCLGYGIMHALGPGHGKLVIGGYGAARQVPMARLVALALIASLAQALVAVGLVYLLVGALGLARGAVEGAAEDWLTPFGHAMIAGLGLWLVWRGVTGIQRLVGPDQNPARADVMAKGSGLDEAHHHGHSHVPTDHADDHVVSKGHDHVHGPGCGHAHGPTLDEVAGVRGFRDGLALVLGIAMRPCSGALFVLILTWQLGIALAGIVGALLMGLGTALVTVAAAVLAVWAREGAFSVLSDGRLARAVPLVELTVGVLMAVAALGLLWQGL